MGIIIPAVNISETDGNLGSADSGKKPLAIVGPAAGGTGIVGQPQGFTQPANLALVHPEGSLADAALDNLAVEGVSVICVRAAGSTVGSHSAVTSTGAGTSVVTLTGTPLGDYEPQLLFTVGGTQGVAGAEYQTSLDGGRNWSPVAALGVAVTIALAGTGVTWALGAGTFLAGQKSVAVSTGPTSSAGDITAALAALTASSFDFEIVEIACPMTAAIYAAVDVWVNTLRTIGRRISWVGHARRPLTTETEATYLAAMNVIFGSLGSTHCLGITFGDVFSSNPINGRQYSRMLYKYAGSLAAVRPHIDVADLGLGAITGYQLTDSTGSYVKHNELVSPGATAARFVTLKNGEGGVGVYWTTPCQHSPVGSDFKYAQHRRVMNVAQTASRAYWLRRLSKGFAVNKKTGKIKEKDRKQMQRDADAYIETVVGAEPMASAWAHEISADDNIISTETLTVDLAITPLAYMKNINEIAHYVNPAISTV